MIEYSNTFLNLNIDGYTEKNSVTDRCSSYYNDFTSVRFYILDSDLSNHAIYYLKVY